MAKRTAPDASELVRHVEKSLPSLSALAEMPAEHQRRFAELDQVTRSVRQEYTTTLAKAEEWVYGAVGQGAIRCVVSHLDGQRLAELRLRSGGNGLWEAPPEKRDPRLSGLEPVGVLNDMGVVRYDVERLPDSLYGGHARDESVWLTTPAMFDLWVQESNAHGFVMWNRAAAEKARKADRANQLCGTELAYINGAMQAIGSDELRAVIRGDEVGLTLDLFKTEHVKALGELLRKAGVTPVPVGKARAATS